MSNDWLDVMEKVTAIILNVIGILRNNDDRTEEGESPQPFSLYHIQEKLWDDGCLSFCWHATWRR